MNLPRQKFRELVFQCLFGRQFRADEESTDVSFYMRNFKTSRQNVLKALAFVERVAEKQKEIDEMIQSTSLGFDLSRIQTIEKNILRLSIFELLFESDVPDKVAISEAIRLAKKFSTKDSVAFVNAIVDHIYKQKSSNLYDVATS